MAFMTSLENSSKAKKLDMASNTQKKTPPDSLLSSSTNMAYNN